MKILLTTLNSKYVHSNLALKYMYGVSYGSGLSVELKEFTINNDMSYIYTEIVRGGYDFVCFSCYIWNIEKIKELGSWIREACPNTRILLGGPEVSYETASFMKENEWVDFVIRGEGEQPFFQFCKELTFDSFDFSKVEGLSYRENGIILENEPGELMPMDDLPFPYDYFEPEKDKVIYYESSRGCPYRCSYCLSSVDKTIRPLSLARTKKELMYFISQDVRQVKFIDRTFNYDKDRAYDIWKFLMDNDNGKTNFHFEICGELLDDNLLALLADAREGLFQFEIGIQSTNPHALAAVDRKSDVTEIVSNVRKLLAPGNSHVHVDLIAGLPYEDYRSFEKSFDEVYEIGADNLQLGFLKLLKGTKIRREAEMYNYSFRQKATYEIISNDFVSSVDIVKLMMIETVLDLYANKGGFRRTLAFLIDETARSPFNFFEQLADFYYSSGYQHRSHKKEDLYRILLKFADNCQAKSDILSERTKNLLDQDLEETMNFDAVKKFHKKGWEI